MILGALEEYARSLVGDESWRGVLGEPATDFVSQIWKGAGGGLPLMHYSGILLWHSVARPS